MRFLLSYIWSLQMSIFAFMPNVIKTLQFCQGENDLGNESMYLVISDYQI